MLQQLPFGLEWLVVIIGGMVLCLYLATWYVQNRKLRRQKPKPIAASHTFITPPDEEKDVQARMLPQDTPHREVLNKRNVWTTQDLAKYEQLTDITYIGEKRAEAIATYLAPKLNTRKKEAWPKEIRDRM